MARQLFMSLLLAACATVVITEALDNEELDTQTQGLLLIQKESVGLRQHVQKVTRHGAADVDAGRHRKSLIVEGTEIIEQQLIVCNAYSTEASLEVVQVRTTKRLTDGRSLVYKSCQDFSVPLQEGDQLDFKSGRRDVGTFYATGLPKYPGSLLLIAKPKRRHGHSFGLSFESHAFAEVQNPQLVVIDAYGGYDKGAVKISEDALTAPANGKGDSASQPVEEELSFNSVVAVNPGNYQISLIGNSSASMSRVSLSAGGQGKYVVMRVGGDSKPQELIVYPRSSGVRMPVSLVLIVTAIVVTLNGIFGSF